MERRDIRYATYLVGSFISRMERLQGIPDLSHLGAKFDIIPLLEDALQDALFTAVNLKECLDRFTVRLPSHNGRVSAIMFKKDLAKLSISSPNPEPDAAHQRFSDWSNVCNTISIIRRALGSHWCPDTISLQARCTITEDVKAEFPGTRFIVDAKETSIEFSSRLLATRMPKWRLRSRNVPEGAGACRDVGILPDALGAILRPYLGYDFLSVDLAAEAAGMSVRSLQRALRAHGLSFSELLERERLDQAEALLMDSGARITDIAFELGYRNSTHFSRAFRNNTGMTPREYRRSRLRPVT